VTARDVLGGRGIFLDTCAQGSANEANGADGSVRQRVELVMIGGQDRSAKLVGKGHRETVGK
jgi:hypothetical protein